VPWTNVEIDMKTTVRAWGVAGAVICLLLVSACTKSSKKPAAAAAACSVPAADAIGAGAGDPAAALAGPAVTVLRGGAATGSFSLDDSSLIIQPPEGGDHPSVPANTAVCEALASADPDGQLFGDAALSGGVAFGYARVTVRDALLDASRSSKPVTSADGTVPPNVPAPSAYRQRLAWVVVVRSPIRSSCPATLAGRTPAPASPTDYDYQIFLVDAKTGTAALAYTEGGPALCGGPSRRAPSVSVPTDWVSVPWALLGRDPDGYTAAVSAEITRCDGYSPVTILDSGSQPTVAVLVQRPIGSACTTVDQRMSFHAATATASIPRALIPAPTGLSIPAPETETTEPFGFRDCGKSVSVKTGTLLVMPAMPDRSTTATYPVTSSDPGVVGPVHNPPTGPITELRAWKPGHADIELTQIPDHMPASVIAGCAKPWILHVTVH
jgi:hypothetical protein